jgi:diguanylate cyclase (GGDEF)-like protein
MHFARLGADNGLSAGGVMAIAQDAQGFLWLGTEDGLDRYDGYEIRRHVRDRGRPDSLPNNWVSGIARGAGDGLFIATDGGGVVAFDAASGDFKALGAIDAKPPLSPQEKVRALHVDTHGALWVATRDGGLVLADVARHVLRRFVHSPTDPATLGSDSVYSIAEDREGSIWVGTDSGLNVVDPRSGRVLRRPLPAPLAPEAGDARPLGPVEAVLQDAHGDIWAATHAGLLHLRAGAAQHGAAEFDAYHTRTGDPHALPSEVVQSLFEDDAGRLWIGTAQGLALYDRAADRFDVYRHDPADPTTLPDDNVKSLYQDRGGLLWVGTKAGGAASWNSRSWSFGHHADTQDGNVAAFAEDAQGTLWIAGVGAGLTAIDREHGVTAHYRHDPADAHGLPDDRVMALLFDHRGGLWLGTMTAGLARLDLASKRFTTYRHDPNDPTTLGAPGVMSLLEDSRGRIWAGTYGGGLSMLDPASGRFVRFTANPADPDSLSSDRATALAEDASGRIWVGTDGGGLCLLHPDSGRVVRFQHQPQDPRSLGANTVYAVRVDARGGVWVGTRGGGLDELVGSASRPQGITFRNFSEAEGLPNTTVYGIEPDAGGRLWLSTNRGLSRFDPVTHEVRNFRRAHGLQADEFNFGAHYRTPRGELLFGGPNGYNAFFPDRLQFDEVPPPVVLTAFLKRNESGNGAVPAERLRDLRLGYRDDTVTFEFAALDFASPQDNRYRYRLEGFDNSWVEAGSRHRVTYTNLAGGRYTFKVRAANSDGRWNDDGLSLPIDVRPPPWATAWAYLAYAAGFALFVFAVWNNQHKKLRREEMYAHRLEQDVRDRTAELALRNEDLERVNRKLTEASLTDPLTGLGNRRFLCDAAAAIVGDGRREPPPEFILLIVDLDHLKPINDQHGHEAGDRILVQVAKILRQSCRDTDYVARWGGDEFVILYRDSDLDAGEVLAERIRSGVAKQIFRLADGKAARTSCSIGFSRYPFVKSAPALLPWEQCLAAADAALYHAKKQRNGWVGWAGTVAAIDVPAVARALERDPEALEREGRLEMRLPKFRPDDTVNNLYNRRRRDT